MILFSNAKDKWASMIGEALNVYAAESGQKINRTKSDLIFSARTNVAIATKIRGPCGEWIDTYQLFVANELTNISYLGSILKIKGDRRGEKDIVMIKVENGLNGWKRFNPFSCWLQKLDPINHVHDSKLLVWLSIRW